MFVQLKPKFNVNYRAGQFYFTKGGSYLSKGISFFLFAYSTEELEKWTHVGICCGENLGIEATFQGIKYIELDPIFNDPNTRIIFREPTGLDEKGGAIKILTNAVKYLNTPYDKLLFISFGVINCFPFKWFPRKWKEYLLKKMNRNDEYICSEFAMQVLRDAGFTDYETSLVTPPELFNNSVFKPLKQYVPLEYEVISGEERSADNSCS